MPSGSGPGVLVSWGSAEYKVGRKREPNLWRECHGRERKSQVWFDGWKFLTLISRNIYTTL